MPGTDQEPTNARLARVERQYWIDRNVALQDAEAWLVELGQLGGLGVPGENTCGATARRLRVVIAAVRIRRGDPGRIAVDVQEILRWAEQHGELALQSRCHDVLGSVFEMVGDRALALEHAVAANDLLEDSEVPLMRAAARKCLADALGSAGSLDEARRRYGEALRLVIDDPETIIRYNILNNLAYTEHLAHNQAEALAAVDQLVGLSEVSDRQIGMYALDTVARVYLTAGRLAEAEVKLLPAMDPAVGNLHPDGSSAALVTLAEIYRTQGKLQQAQTVIDRSRELSQRFGLIRWSTEAAREQAELYGANGDFRAAFEAYRHFHEQSEALGASENESRGRILEAVFQTAESRRESERYRELAERDPLTGLQNRRFVDEHLSAALMRLRDGGPTVAIAMVDLDHFKRINDTLSHEVGDTVLREVGRILIGAAASAPDGIAARLGGEEFLLIMPGIDADEAYPRFDAVCRAIADHDWSPITGTLPVTASIGVALAPADGQQSSDLLRAADVRLYVAKRDGRNRVVHAAVIAMSASEAELLETR